MKTVIILVGPKGSGKTTIGKSVSESLSIKFLDVEKLLMEYILKNSCESSDLPKHGFDIEKEEIVRCMELNDVVIVEATGSSEYFEEYYLSLCNLFRVILIKIECTYEECIKRIDSRTPGSNFFVEEIKIKEIYLKSIKANFNWEYIIDTTGNYDESGLEEFISRQFA